MNLKKTVSQSIKVLLCLALGLFILWLAFRNVEFSEIANGLKSANYWWLVLSLFFGIAAYFVRAARWNLLIDPLGYRPKFINSFHAVMVGYFANIAVPRIGEVTKCVALSRKESIPVDKLLGTVLIERTIDVITTVLITVVFFLFAGDNVIQFLRESIYEPIRGSIGLTLGFWLFLAFGLLFVGFMVLYRKKLSNYKLFAKVFGFCGGIVDGFAAIAKMEKRWGFILYTLLIWLCYVLMTWFVVFCLESTSGLGLGDAVFLLIIGTFGMMVPVQSGFGAFHYIVSKGLAFVYGITIEDGLIYAIISHESQILLMILIGSISTFFIFGKRIPENISSKE